MRQCKLPLNFVFGEPDCAPNATKLQPRQADCKARIHSISSTSYSKDFEEFTTLRNKARQLDPCETSTDQNYFLEVTYRAKMACDFRQAAVQIKASQIVAGQGIDNWVRRFALEYNPHLPPDIIRMELSRERAIHVPALLRSLTSPTLGHN